MFNIIKLYKKIIIFNYYKNKNKNRIFYNIDKKKTHYPQKLKISKN